MAFGPEEWHKGQLIWSDSKQNGGLRIMDLFRIGRE
jgi:hypothetical protein